MSNKRIDLTPFYNVSAEGWEYLSDESRNINDDALDKMHLLLAELQRCYEIIDSIPEGILDKPCEGCNTLRIGYYDNNVCEHDNCDKCIKCCTCPDPCDNDYCQTCSSTRRTFSP